jgi:hypothetical protein
MRVLLVFVLILSFGLGCKDGDKEAIESKCDASLRLRAEELAKSGEDGPLDVLGRADGPIDQDRRDRLGRAGATLTEVTNDLFTARIPVKRLGDVASLDFVRSLALSQTREPLGR